MRLSGILAQRDPPVALGALIYVKIDLLATAFIALIVSPLLLLLLLQLLLLLSLQ
jgi:hypothetical protein